MTPGLYRHRGPDGRVRYVSVRFGPDGRLVGRFPHGEQGVTYAGGEWDGPHGSPFRP